MDEEVAEWAYNSAIEQGYSAVSEHGWKDVVGGLERQPLEAA